MSDASGTRLDIGQSVTGELDSALADAGEMDGTITVSDGRLGASDSGVLAIDMAQDQGTMVDTGAEILGSTANTCGAPEDGLAPIDCTLRGDEGAVCVFSNHCLCSDGFVCERLIPGLERQECDPGITCVRREPDGSRPTDCGQGDAVTDCTVNGDLQAQCVFSDHCLCSDAFACELDPMPDDGFQECDPGAGCLPRADNGFVGASANSCGSAQQGLVPVDCQAAGDTEAGCVFGNHCLCSEGHYCAGGPVDRNECQPGEICLAIP